MSVNRLRFIAVCSVAALALAGAARAEDLVIPGSGNPEFVLTQLAKVFNGLQSQHRVTVPPSTGTAGALRDVEAGAASMGRVGRPLKAEELSRGLSYVPLGRDAVVFVAGAAVTVRSVSPSQVLDAYGGRISDWRELGGRPAPIRAIGREVTDASRQAISRRIKPFESIAFSDSVKVVHLDPEMIDLLDRYPTSLGFLNQSALHACKTRIVLLALDGTAPTPENLDKGIYPIWIESGLIYKADTITPAGRAFLEFIRSAQGVAVLREYGVLPPAAAR